jgi:non-heme chloroperoxidase
MRIACAGTSLEYVERGSGEPLVFVHGSASDHRSWLPQLEYFGDRYRTVVYSRRYHWPNEPIVPGAPYSMPQHVDDLAGVLGQLGAAPAHLVGHSYGGFVALLLAIRHPDLVRTLVLEEPPVLTLFVGIPPRPHELLKLLLTRPRTAVAIMKFGARGLGPATAAVRRGDLDAAIRCFGTAVLGAEAFGRLTAARLEQVRANFFAEELLGDPFAPLGAEQVRSVRAPTLLVTGQRSPRLFHRLADRLHELLPHAERTEVAGASHNIHEDDPPAFNRAVLAHLQRYARTA